MCACEHFRDKTYSLISNSVLPLMVQIRSNCSQSSLIMLFVCIIASLVVIALANGCGSNSVGLYFEIY